VFVRGADHLDAIAHRAQPLDDLDRVAARHREDMGDARVGEDLCDGDAGGCRFCVAHFASGTPCRVQP
jgi:hypothetical protein